MEVGPSIHSIFSLSMAFGKYRSTVNNVLRSQKIKIMTDIVFTNFIYPWIGKKYLNSTHVPPIVDI